MTTKFIDERTTQTEEPYTRDIRNDEPASMAAVRTIAAVVNTPVDELEPIAAWLDPDALDAIVDQADGATVEFEYGGFTVIIDGGSVTVRDATET